MAMPRTLVEMFEPATYPPPRLDGWQLAWRYGVSVLAYVLIVSAVIFMVDPSTVPTSDSAGGPGSIEITGPGVPVLPLAVGVLDAALGLVALAIIHLRRRWPLTISLTLTAASAVSMSVSVVVVWAFLSLCTRRRLVPVLIGLVASVISGAASLALPWNNAVRDATPTNLVTGVVVTMGLALVGLYVGVRRDRRAAIVHRAEQADAEREFAVLAERNRIAREMHDVLAHRISLVSMHAGVLAYRSDLDPEKTREIAHIIQENAHASLTELRSVLSSLREAPDAGVAAPQPTLARLPELIAEARASGQRLEVTGRLEEADLSAATSRHVYRILQECLTNARKHAPEASVALHLAGTPDEGITLVVSNAITRVSAAIPGARLGLVGVGERAAMLEGRLSAGERGGTFVVEAWLPWSTENRRTP